jgi:glutathione S-transferase
MAARLLVLAFALLGCAQAQSGSDAGHDAELRLGLLATKAVAAFRGADAIAANLEAQGMMPRSELTTTRKAIERALDRAEASLARRDWCATQRSLDRAAALLSGWMQRAGTN